MSKTDNTLRKIVHQMAVKERDNQQYNFTILKSNKDKFQLVEKLSSDAYVSIEGIHKFKFIICTRLKQINNLDESKQLKLGFFE